MRILNIRFQNLNSLVGEWEIDLTHPAYLSDGIFVITGPTGAGKTTILDAVCLALYGRTPRLGSVTLTENEIMSRQKGECFAEVTFETVTGRFRCHWSQRRARKKADGKLQSPRHELSDVLSQKTLESSIRGVAEQVEKLTGMDFERFTRSMLLAQGGFAAFLQAPPDQRSPILEQLTGTEIYTDISRRTHERLVAERARFDTLEAELSGLRLLDETERQTLLTELASQRKHVSELEQQTEQTRLSLRWLDDLAAIRNELAELEQRRKALEERANAFAPERLALQRANRALECAGTHAELASTRAAQEQDARQQLETNEALPHRETERQEAEKTLAAATTDREQAKSLREQGLRLVRAVRELDVAIRNKETALTTLERELAERDGTLKETQETARQQALRLQAGQSELTDLLAQLEATATDQTLAEQLSGLRQHLEHWQQLLHDEQDAARAAKDAAARRDTVTAGHARLLTRRDEQQRTLLQLEQTLARQQAAQAACLDAKPLAEWHARQLQAATRLAPLDKAEDALRQCEAARQTLHDLERRQAELDTAEQGCRHRLERTETARREQETTLERLEARRDEHNRLHALLEARRRLRDGEPCPLCGALEHPAASLPLPAPVDEDLSQCREQLRQLDADVLAIRSELAAANLERTRLHEQRQTTQRVLDEQTERARDALLLLQEAFDENAPEAAARIPALRERCIAEAEQAARVLAQAEAAEADMAVTRTALEAARNEVGMQEKALLESATQKEHAEQEARHAEQARQGLTTQQDALRQTLLEALAPYALPDFAELFELSDPAGLLAALTRRRDDRLNREKHRDSLQQQLAALEADSRHLAARTLDMERERALRVESRRTLIEELEDLRRDRHNRLGDTDPDTEEHRLETLLENADTRLDAARKALEAVERQLATLHSRREALEQTLAARQTRLDTLEETFRERLAQAGFADETDYTGAILSEEARNTLAQKEQALLTARAELLARHGDATARLALEQAKKRTEQPREALEATLAQLVAQLKTQQEAVGSLRQQLEEDEKTRLAHRERADAVEAQRRECLRWNALHELIGSADGKKYRNFVQVLTFEIMIDHANRELRRMTDRYLLIRNKEVPLALDVIDAYQAGEVRSTKNLSGGESFIVSLALALGLSRMASRTVRVDSLFLDEGFGTLDEDTLDTALDTLAGLHRDGKLIGVISHVATLKERIGTQIQVTPGTGGRSRISGPGCSQAGA